MPHAGASASIAHLGKKLAERAIRTVFKRRSGFELPVKQRDAEGVTFADVASAAHLGDDLPIGMPPGLDESYFFDPMDMPFAYGAQVAAVEVDPETGHIALLRHVMVDDCGRAINPLLVEGQMHGGAAQGIGQALMEAVVHGSGGEPLVRGFSEYAMPHARDLPAFETGHTQIPTKLNPLGVRGVGEGATIGATPAVVNAVLDALAPLSVTEVPIPMTPMRVWRAVERARHDLVAMTTEDSHRDSSPVGKLMHAN
jgi:aerobic carbon-monoxide dehydrogenase large subunit